MGVVAGMLFEKDKHNDPVLSTEKFPILAKRLRIMVEHGLDHTQLRSFIDSAVAWRPD